MKYKNIMVSVIAMIFIISLPAIALVPDPNVYLPFNEDFNNYGASGYGEQGYLRAINGTVPELGPGFVGKCFDIRKAETIDNSGFVAYGNHGTDQSGVEEFLDFMTSFTITLWVSAGGELDPNGVALKQCRLMDRYNTQNIEISCDLNGAPRLRVNGLWIIVPIDGDGAPSPNGWTFYAITYDSTVATGEIVGSLYMANPDEGMPYTLREVDIDDTRRRENALFTFSAGHLLVGNKELILGKQGMDGMIDELRIWGNKVDGSGVLSFSQIEEVLQLDAAASVLGECGDWEHQYSNTDFNQDCIVNFEDYSTFAEGWLTNTGI